MVFGIVTTIFGIVMFATAAPASRNIWVVLPAMGIGYIVFAVVHRAKANKIKSDGSGDAAGQ